MKNGDISNETSPRIIVLAEVVVNRKEETQKKLFKSKTVFKVGELNQLELIKLWSLTNKYGLSTELAGLESEGWTQELLDKVMDILDRRGGNPFNYAQMYSTPQELVGDLPYRVNLRGVIDIPSRIGMYGSHGVELQNL